MNELYFWGATFVVGLLLLKLLPAEKLKGANRKMREKIPGFLLAVMYVLIGVLLIVGSYLLCFFLNAPAPLTMIIVGSILGAFIGLIPLVDVRHSK